MFDFTTENLLNDLSRVSSASGVLSIQRLNRFLDANVDKVFKATGNAPVNEVATITIPAGQAAGIFRFELELETSGDYPIDYDRWAVNKGKPFTFEFALDAATASADAFATAALPKLNKALVKMNGTKIKDFSFSKGTGTLIVTTSNEHLRVKKATITKLTADESDFASIGATFAITTAGKQGFGTSWDLLKNFRIPTQEATRFMGEDQDERPVNGVLYNQYTFRYFADRNITGQGAVGQTIKSVTTHVLYVPQSLAATFEAHIKTAFGTASLYDSITGADITPA